MKLRLVAVVAMLLLAGVPATPPGAAQEEREPHPPIKIANDEQWESCSCVSGGNGTAEDPWIIEDLLIATGRWHVSDFHGPAIHILFTDDHAILRNLTIVDTEDSGQGEDGHFGVADNGTQTAITTEGADNLTIENITLMHGTGRFFRGLSIQGGHNLEIHHLDLSNVGVGIGIVRDNIGGGVANVSVHDVKASGLVVHSNGATVHNVTVTEEIRGRARGGAFTDIQAAEFTVTNAVEATTPLRVERLTTDRFATGHKLGSDIFGENAAKEVGPARLVDSTIGEGGLDGFDSDLTVRNVSVAGDLAVSPKDHFLGGLGHIQITPDVVLDDVQVGGDLSVKNPARISTDGNRIEGGYSVWSTAEGIESWTIGEPDTAMDGRQVRILRAGETLEDTTVPYATVLGTDPGNPAVIENVTFLSQDAQVGIYLQGNAVARDVEPSGQPVTALLVNAADLTVTDSTFDASARAIRTIDSTLTLDRVDVVDGRLQVAGSTALVRDSTLAGGIFVDGDGELTLEGSRVRGDRAGIYSLTRGDTGQQITLRSSVIESAGPAIRADDGTQVTAQNCILESTGEVAGGTFTSGIDVYYTVGVNNQTVLDTCTIEQKRAIVRDDNGNVYTTDAIRNAPTGRDWGRLDVHRSNIVTDGTHYGEGVGPPIGITDLTHNWWGPNDLPISDGFGSHDPLHFQPFEQAPSVDVVATDDGWRIDATDDHALIETAYWRLPDGQRVDAEGTWPMMDTELPADRLGPGGHHVTAHAVDAAGLSTGQHAPLLVPDPAGDPVVVIDGPLTGAPGETLTYEARHAGDVSSIAWDINDDGTTDATGATLELTPTDDGITPLSVTVSDGAGTTATDRITIDIENPPPEAAIDAPSTATVGQTVTLSDASTDDGTIGTVEWDVHADGTTDATGATFELIPASPGLHLVELRAFDDDGAKGIATAVLDVAPADPSAPSLQVAPVPPAAGDPVTFTLSQDGDWAWDIGAEGVLDGHGRSLDWRFAHAGTYPVHVLDADGTTVLEATVDVVEPTTLSVAADTAPAGEVTTLSARGEGWDGFAWDVGADGTTDANGPTTEILPDTPGELDVRLTARSGPEQATVERVLRIGERDRSLALGLEPSTSVAPLNATLNVRLDSPDLPTAWTLDLDGDGTVDREGDGLAPASHPVNVSTPGTYTATLSLTFDDGALNQTIGYEVLDPAQTAPDVELGVIAHETPVEGETIDVTLHATSATGLEAYEVCLATCQQGTLDGTDDTAQLTFTASAGTARLDASVTDAEGNVGTASEALATVQNTPPQLGLDVPARIDAEERFEVGVDARDPEARDLMLDWQVPELGLSGHGVPNLTLPGGVHELVVTASDPSGASAQATVTLSVLEHLDLALDAETVHGDRTGGLAGLELAIQPTWSTQAATVTGNYTVEHRALPQGPWLPIASGTFEGTTQTIHVDRPIPPGQARVTVDARAAETPPYDVGEGGLMATAVDHVDTGVQR